jgi:FkbH-like protein
MTEVDQIFRELDQDLTLSAYGRAARRLQASSSARQPFRAAILSNHTFDIRTPLTVECARRGLELTLFVAAYDQYRQELLAPNASLDQFGPDAVFISLHLENTFPAVSAATCGSIQPLPSPAEWVEDFRTLLGSYRQRSKVPIFIQNFVPLAVDMDGLLGASIGRSLFQWVGEMNSAIARMTSTLESVYPVDVARLASASNLANWRDPRLFYLAKVGVNPKRFPTLAAHVARCFAALRRPAAKCLVLDLDGTVWGGILGDLGPDGVHCAGPDYPGCAYAEFQRAVLALRSRGILLAVASKNDLSLVQEVFQKRADMPLRSEHFSDWEVHWGSKPESLQRIAARLNIGLDSLVFLDDNPAEADLMKMALPVVRTYLLPPRPEDFVSFLARVEDFDQLQLSAEDMRRPELYELRKKQAVLVQSTTDLESFYRSLHTVVTPDPAGEINFGRIVQLLQKTNQFNLTTRRYDKTQLLERLEQGCELWAFRVEDVHGDHGLVAVALLEFDGAECLVDSLLMSCRVIGRTVETAILSFLEDRALARGAERIKGEYLRTARNSPCQNFYHDHDFDCSYQRDNRSEWQKRLKEKRTACPEWIRIEKTTRELCPQN